MMFKRVLITGASSGIGLAIAEALAALGVDLVLWARRAERLERIRAQLEQRHGIRVLTGVVDVRDRVCVDDFISAHALELADLDVLVNNAGLAKGVDKLPEARVEDFDVMIDTNVKGLLYVTRALLPLLLKRPVAHVVNIGSVAGRWVYPGGAVYCASKFAVRALSEGLRMDVAGSGVRVTNIEPGMVETEFSEVRFEDQERAKAVYRGVQALSAGDIAETVTWCLQRPAHVNIQELVIFPTDQAAIQMVHRHT
jgi:NADP-dependent 3-hydroxy acid dehydrogenase YdfG